MLMRKYKIVIFRELNPIPAIFRIKSEKKRDELEKDIMLALDGNAIKFVDTKGKTRIYDRNWINRIFITKG